MWVAQKYQNHDCFISILHIQSRKTGTFTALTFKDDHRHSQEYIVFLYIYSGMFTRAVSIDEFITFLPFAVKNALYMLCFISKFVSRETFLRIKQSVFLLS